MAQTYSIKSSPSTAPSTVPVYPAESLSALGAVVQQRFSDARMWRNQLMFGGASLETWFARTYRMYNSMHDPDELAREKKRSGVDLCEAGYFAVGRIKADAASAYLLGKYAHAMEAPFVLLPSRSPQLSQQQQTEVSHQLSSLLRDQLQALGLGFPDVWDAGKKKISEPIVQKWLTDQTLKLKNLQRERALGLAREAAAYHHGVISDQLGEGGWRNAAAVIMHNLVAEPYTALCAREYRDVALPRWRGNKVQMHHQVIPHFRAINPRDLYLAPDASNAQDGSGVTELTSRTLADLLALRGTAASDSAVVVDNLNLLIASMLDKTYRWDWLNRQSADGSKVNSVSRIDSLLHEGLFSGRELAASGKPGLEDSEFYTATIEVIGGRVIYFSCEPFGEDGRSVARRYYTAQHSRTMQNSYAGESVLTKLFYLQNEINTALYVAKRNLYHSSGPAVVVHGNYFNRPQDISLQPYARNWANPAPQLGSQRGVEQINVQSLFLSHNSHIATLMSRADEVAGVPSLFSGLSRGGVSRTTLGGAVLEQTNGERMMDMSILNLDTTLIEPMVEHLHLDNLLWEDMPDEYRRGDIKVQGRGIYGLKEVELKQRLLTQSLPLLLQTSQAGITPKPMLDSALKDYYEQSGIDTSSMIGPGSQAELRSAATNAPQTHDGRTYNPETSMTGVP